MAVLQIVRLYAASAATATDGTGVSNLITPDPKEVWVAAGGGNNTLTLDLGAKQLVDTLALIGSNLPIGATVNLFVANLADFSDAVSVGAGVPVAASVRAIGAPQVFSNFAARYVRYLRIQTTNIPTAIVPQAGCFVAGRSFSASYGHEWGAGRSVVDTGNRERLIGGGFGIQAGVRKAGWRWTLADLTDAETQILNDIARETGETVPLLVVEDPALGELIPTVSANAAIAGRVASKSGGTNGVSDSLILCATPLAASLVSFRPGQAAKQLAMGLHGTAAAANCSLIDYSIFIGNDNYAYVREAGNFVGGSVTATATDLFAVGDDGGTIGYFKNGTIWHRTAKTLNKQLYFNGGFVDSPSNVADLVVAPAGLPERIHYGMFDRFEAYERRAPDLTKWGLAIEDWV